MDYWYLTDGRTYDASESMVSIAGDIRGKNMHACTQVHACMRTQAHVCMHACMRLCRDVQGYIAAGKW